MFLLLQSLNNSFLIAEIFCRALEKPQRGSVTPGICVTRFANIRSGTSCRFNCSKGHEISARLKEKTISCHSNGFWDSPVPSCKRKSIEWHLILIMTPVLVS